MNISTGDSFLCSFNCRADSFVPTSMLSRRYLTGRSGKLARFMIDEYLTKAPDSPAKGKAINIAWPVKSVGDIDMPDDVEMRHWPLPNVWLGVSAEDQKRADERIPDLLATPAAVRFVSAEPLLGPLHLDDFCDGHKFVDWLRGNWWHDDPDGPPGAVSCGHERIDWVIVGGESGPGARPMHPVWVRSLRDQCAAAGTAFFFKQWGAFRQLTAAERGQACGATFISGCDRYDQEAYVLLAGKKAAGRLLDGVEHNAMPEVRR